MFDLLLATVHTEFATGAKAGFKCVTCAGCGADYFYILTVTAEAVARTAALVGDKEAAQATAVQRAEEKLARKFDRRDDPIPCPKCGALQDNMLLGLRRKHGEPAKNWAAITVAFAGLGGLGAALWLSIGVQERSKGFLITGAVFAAISLVGLIASYFTVRRFRRIWRADGKADVFRADVLQGRKNLLPVETVLPAVRRQLAELDASDGAERQRLEAILDRIAAVIPRSEWDNYQVPGLATNGGKPWKRSE